MDILVRGLDSPLNWAVPPVDVAVGEDGAVTVEAGPKTDVFVDPQTSAVTATAPRALVPVPDGDFQLLARVSVDFRSTYDAGVLVIWFDDRHSAKLCFELSPQGQPTIVSVITRDVSDDANGWPVAGDQAWLRISRIGATWAFHASVDGQEWALARYFRLEAQLPARVGILAQSPLGEGCKVRFDHLEVRAHRLAELRDGS